MKISGCTVLVTGAARGIGRSLVDELLVRGAKKVYASDISVGSAGSVAAGPAGAIEWIHGDVTSDASVGEIAQHCSNIDILINNAGVNSTRGIFDAAGLAGARREIEVNLFGTLAMCRSFVPHLRGRPRAAIVNMLSSTVHVPIPAVGSYSVSKAAAAAMSGLLRSELDGSTIHLLGVFPGAIDTPMIASLDIPKLSIADAAKVILDALESGRQEVLVGDE